MSKSIKISDEDYNTVEMIKDLQDWTFTKTLSKAISFFANAKRLTPDKINHYLVDKQNNSVKVKEMNHKRKDK